VTTRAHLGWLITAITVGLITGALTLGGQAVLPTEANRLANSGAIWVTVAFAVGWRSPSDLTAAAAGLVTLVAALVGYFVTAAVAGAGVSTSTVAIWVGVALVGGPVFGVAGRWRGARDGDPNADLRPAGADWRPTVAVAALGAVYLAEGLWTLWTIPHMALAGWLSLLVGVVLTLLLARGRRMLVRSAALLVPLTALGVACFVAIDAVFGAV
jgi:hypothetical protein